MMLDMTTVNKLNEMRITAMARAFTEQLSDPQYNEMSFEERFGLLVDIEWSRRKNNQLTRLLKNACIQDSNACIENTRYDVDRKLDKSQILRLATNNYIAEKRNIIILGATGAGKSFMGNAFAVAACRGLYTTRCVRLPDLLDELAISRGEGTFRKTMKAYKKVALLVIDEWLLSPLKDVEAQNLLEIIEARHQTCSTIFVSQYSPAGWRAQIGEGAIAEAVLDRIIHNSHTIFIDGKISMRERFALERQNNL
ncbi:transposase/IS protein [Pelotomaculum sp. FP]|uniref:ATP-binding protein n=1 Tax=Pelotomaculum sp. FP TaxID=261474 RepID=UPI001102D3D1|nr:transposase/IS protein [Pelotomaculum sp. FP]